MGMRRRRQYDLVVCTALGTFHILLVFFKIDGCAVGAAAESFGRGHVLRNGTPKSIENAREMEKPKTTI